MYVFYSLLSMLLYAQLRATCKRVFTKGININGFICFVICKKECLVKHFSHESLLPENNSYKKRDY